MSASYKYRANKQNYVENKTIETLARLSAFLYSLRISWCVTNEMGWHWLLMIMQYPEYMY